MIWVEFRMQISHSRPNEAFLESQINLEKKYPGVQNKNNNNEWAWWEMKQ